MEPRTKAREVRTRPTEPERRSWSGIRARSLVGARFDRPVPIGPHIGDFVARSCRPIVEIDRDSHALRQAYDRERTSRLEALGCTVIRFRNTDVMTDLTGVADTIASAIAVLPFPNPSRERKGS